MADQGQADLRKEIEELKRRIAELEQAELAQFYLAAIVASADDAIISKTPDGIITSWNLGAERIFGYTPSEIVGQSILRIVPPELHAEEHGLLARITRG